MMPYDDEEEDEEAELPPGTDNAAIYRAALDQMVGMQADEEGHGLGHLQTYPNTVFRKQITERMDKSLARAMFKDLGAHLAEVAVNKGKQRRTSQPACSSSPSIPAAAFGWGLSGATVLDQLDRQLRAADRPRLLRPRWNGSSIHRLEPRGWRATVALIHTPTSS